MIVPRNPSPVPLEDRPVESLTHEEAQELIRRQHARLAAAPRVKSEPRNGIKRERVEEGPLDTPHKRRTVGDDGSNGEADGEEAEVKIISVFTKSDRNKEIEVIDLSEE